MDSMTLTTKQIDRDFTRDWQDICLGYFNIRLPPSLLPLQKRDVRFDGYQFETSPAKYDKALHSKILEKEKEINSLQVPDGLDSVIHRKEGDRHNDYLVAYRDGGNEFPDTLKIHGMKKIGKTIVTLHQDVLDGYKQPENDGTEQNQWFIEDYNAAQRILRLLRSIKKPAKPGTGFCLNNQFIISGNSITEAGNIIKFSMPSNEYLFKIRVSTLSGTKDGFNLSEHLKNITQEKDTQRQVQLAIVNSMEGGFIRAVDEENGEVEYGWLYVEPLPNTKRELVIQIQLEERDSPYIGKDKDDLDRVFTNILASFYRRG